MYGKRLALAAFAATLVVLVPGGLSNSTGQTQGTPGVTYGGAKGQYPAWLRLNPERNEIAAMLIEWAAAPERCSNRKKYSGILRAGYEEANWISVNQEGQFRETIVDRITIQRTRYEDRQLVQGTISDDVATGSISGRVKIVKPSGQVVRCNFGPQRWTLVD